MQTCNMKLKLIGILVVLSVATLVAQIGGPDGLRIWDFRGANVLLDKATNSGAVINNGSITTGTTGTLVNNGTSTTGTLGHFVLGSGTASPVSGQIVVSGSTILLYSGSTWSTH